jgi:hypothetical protein
MYSPKIYPDQVRKLYFLKMSYATLGHGIPSMTQLVREALEKFIPEKANEVLERGGTLLRPDEITKK